MSSGMRLLFAVRLSHRARVDAGPETDRPRRSHDNQQIARRTVQLDGSRPIAGSGPTDSRILRTRSSVGRNQPGGGSSMGRVDVLGHGGCARAHGRTLISQHSPGPTRCPTSAGNRVRRGCDVATHRRRYPQRVADRSSVRVHGAGYRHSRHQGTSAASPTLASTSTPVSAS